MKRLSKTKLNLNQLEARIAPAGLNLTWQGDINDQWSGGTLGINTNWSSTPGPNRIPVDNAALIFPDGAANKTNNNDIAGLDLRSLSFTGTGYEITGEAITLSGGITANVPSAGIDRFHPTISLTANQVFSSTSTAGAVFEFDSIDLGGNSLTVDGAFTVVLGTSTGTQVSGQGSLIKRDTGRLILPRENAFTGSVQVDGGILEVRTISSLGAAGSGNETTIASGSTLIFTRSVDGTVAEDITVGGAGAAGQPGAIILNGAATGNGADVTLSGRLRLGADATISGSPLLNDQLLLAGRVGAADDALAILTVKSASLTSFAFANTATLTTELAGTTPGASGHDQLKIIGTVNLGGASLEVVPSFTPSVGDTFTIVDNDGTDAITGTFAGLAEGAAFLAGGVNFTISYVGGTNNNDVVLTVTSLVDLPLDVTISSNGKIATFIDVDGDVVTVSTNKGPFQQSDFSGVATGVAGGGQLQLVNLTTHPDDFQGANLSITAKPGPLGGNGFVNVGRINATGIDLGAVTVAGDLGGINAGTVGGNLRVPALKSLTVESIGLLGSSTQSAGNSLSRIEGALQKFVVKSDFRDVGFVVKGVQDGRLGNVSIGGSVRAIGASGIFFLFAEAGIQTLKIGGDIFVESDGSNFVSSISSGGPIGAISVGGSITSPSRGLRLEAFGRNVAPVAGLDLAIGSLTVAGSVKGLLLQLGRGLNENNADASIGKIAVGGDWIASSVTAGTDVGTDGRTGTADDVKLGGSATRDNSALFSTVGSFTVKGQAIGTPDLTGDMFGIVAERIGRARVGGRTFAFKPGTNEAFFAAPTAPGAGAENPAFDFTIRELGSVTPTPAFGGANLVISVNGRTATFTDVDGDFVTIKTNVGAFESADFDIAAQPSGGGQLSRLDISNDVAFAGANITITAKPGPDGGNGFVNVGAFFGTFVNLGRIRIAGDLAQFEGGTNNPARPGVKSLTVHSIGALGLGTGAFQSVVNFLGGVGTLNVLRDLHAVILLASGAQTGKLGSVFIAGSFVGDGTSFILANEIGSVKIGGSFHDAKILVNSGEIGNISIGGDLVGDASNDATIQAFGQSSAPAKGLDLAIKSLTVRGNVENARIEVGTGGSDTNADASIGKINVGRAWIASSVLAGVDVGADAFLGTEDDTKDLGITTTRDNVAIFSTISSIIIKGQALGSTAAGDSFGIVAEWIGKAKIGKRTLKFDKGERDAADAFALGPTGPGPTGLLSDLFIREITV